MNVQGQHEVEKDTVAWDPQAAHASNERELRERRRSEELQETLRRTAGTELGARLASKTVTFVLRPGEQPQTLTVPEYADWMEEQAEAAALEVQRYGGAEAVKHYEDSLDQPEATVTPNHAADFQNPTA